ncbi:hypothetical protein GMB86_13815 [Terrilactibacillus sp. BCM23-1]|uniref:Preprotein translocase subunit Tim44 n=1 Tax=Terrilactibacillus tamarindi TaxID=2599694 RepID=A0A6N8CSF0_9BACI|nr:hypothetical protein [Terrilactibacillus tamarindi]MTT33084.1 hypothetical protein [Terrilactibacillus tamarindi]
MMKKIAAAFLALTLVFTPIASSFVFFEPNTASAKGYRSGVKSFKGNNNSGSFFNSNKSQRNNSTATRSNGSAFNRGGFMRGMFLGGLSGLLFGSMLANMGAFGQMAGLLINILAIVAIIALIRYIFFNRKRNRKNEDDRPWGNR